MKRTILLAALLALGTMWVGLGADSFVVGIEQSTAGTWSSLGAQFESQTGISISTHPFPQSSIAQQVVLQAFTRSNKLNFVMIPNSWATSLQRYFEDIADAADSLTRQGIEPIYAGSRAVGVPISFAEGWFMAVLQWPSNQDAAVQWLTFVGGGAGTPSVATTSSAGAPPSGTKGAASQHNVKLDGALESLIAAAHSAGGAVATNALSSLSSSAIAAMKSVASLFGIPLSSDGATVTVVLESSPGRSGSSNVAALAALGVSRSSIESSSTLVKVSIPVGQLASLAAQLSGVAFIRPPYTPYPLATPTQGVAAIGASAYHTAGIRGAGTKVAVIDLGFAGLSQAQARGDLPYSVTQNDLTGTGLASGLTHGTAVAEIVYDVAPDAQLYLIKIGDEVDLDQAVTYCLSNGIDIINHSLGWYNTNFYDGTGTIADTARRAINGGILWINAAGNEAQSHWEGTFVDGNADGWHDQTLSFYAAGGSPITVYLTWNEWPQSSTDYDLYVYKPDGSLLASSTKHQTGTEEPTESIQTTASQSGTYTVRFQGVGSRTLEIYNLYQSLSPSVAASSILAPANVAEVVAVGAVAYSNYTTGPQEPYSSQGPTNDGRTKPDLVCPDNVSTGTAPYTTFPGTSGAAPHAAGAAALLLSQQPSLSGPALRTLLLSNTVAMGSANVFGQGRLSLQAPTPGNQSPIASFSFSPTSPTAGASVTFYGSASNDPDGSIVNYAWTFGDGATGSGMTASHAYASAGNYTARLTVTDNGGATGTTTQTVPVSSPGNQPPTAAFSFSPASPTAGTSVTFYGNASNDPDGSIVNYAWTFGDGATGSGMTASHAYASAGNYTARLTVTDNGGATGTTTQTVPVSSPGNQPPTAAFSFSPASPTAGTSVTFYGNASNDPDGSIVNYAWTFGDGATGSGMTASHAYASAGNYTARLTVTDNGGATGTTTQTVPVFSPTNQPPVAAFSYTPTNPNPGAAVAFNATASYDPDGSIVSYAWTFGDGGSGFGVATSHTYGSPGTYSVTLAVRDAVGATSNTTQPVVVQIAASADLTPTNLTYSPSNPALGQSVGFAFTLVNQGNASAGGFRVLLSGSSSSTNSYVTQLAAGATRAMILYLPLTTSPETFTIRLDDLGQIAESNEGNNTQSIVVSASTPAPAAEAGGPYTGTVGVPIQFNGSASTGSITSYFWSFGDGGSGSGVTPSHSYGGQGTYTATLTVSGPGGSSTDSTTVVVGAAQPPLSATVTLPKTSYTVGEAISITLATNRSAYLYLCEVTADNRVVLIYPNLYQSNPLVGAGAHVIPGSGYTLRASEPVGAESLHLFAATSPIPGFPTSFGSSFPTLSTNPTSFRTSVLATMQSIVPSGDWSFHSVAFNVVYPTPTTGTIRVLSTPSGATVQLDGSNIGTTPLDRPNVSPGSHTVQVSRSGYQSETRNVTVTAGATTTVQVTLTTVPTNQAPTAVFTYTPSAPKVGDVVSFSAAGSSDPDGTVIAYAWNLGDGTTATGPTPSHAYSTNGTYTVQLTVTDNGGKTGTTSKSLTMALSDDVGWVSPVGFEDPGNHWDREEMAYDSVLYICSNTASPNCMSFASYLNAAPAGWTSYLLLKAPGTGIASDRIRLVLGDNVSMEGDVFTWQVDVLVDGHWIQVYEGLPPEEKEWIEASFPQGLVTQVRLRARNDFHDYRSAQVWEVDFRDATIPAP